MNVTLAQLEKQLESSLTALEGKRDRVEIVALKGIEAEYKERLFEDGLSTNGSKIGKYVSNWKKKRAQKGRQTGFVDQNFNSDNQRSIQVGKASGSNVMGFLTDKQRLIAEGAENYRKKDIYVVSEKEIDFGIEQGTEEILKIWKDGFDKV